MSEKLPKEIIEKVIIEGDFELMWKLFKTISPDKRIYEKVKNGIKLKFPITWYLKGRYEEFPSAGKKGRLRLHGYGETTITAFEEEIEAREQIMLEEYVKMASDRLTRGRLEDIEHG